MNLTASQAAAVLPRAETILEVAALVARLPDDELLSLHASLAIIDGPEHMYLLLRQVARLDPEERLDLIEELTARTGVKLHTA